MRGRYTRVARYGYGRTTPYKTEIYAFADDGKFIANYEDSDDAPGVRFVSADRYNAYLTVLGEGGKKVTVDGSERRTVDLSSPSVTIFESDEFSADVSPGERLVVTAEVRITDVTRREEGAIASFGVTGDAESPRCTPISASTADRYFPRVSTRRSRANTVCCFSCPAGRAGRNSAIYVYPPAPQRA